MCVYTQKILDKTIKGVYTYIMPRMNLYITRDNENNLRQVSDHTMSGLVNYLLHQYFDNHTKNDLRAVDKKIQTMVALVGDAIQFCKHDAVKGLCKKGCK